MKYVLYDPNTLMIQSGVRDGVMPLYNAAKWADNLPEIVYNKKYATYIEPVVDVVDGVLTVMSVTEDIDGYASDRIHETKRKLTNWLARHPMLWKDGKYYSVTEAKQTLLMNALATYNIESQIIPDAVVMWNATGEESTVWEPSKLKALAIAIKDYVRPFVAYQQAKEVEIKSATTLAEIFNIVVDYSEVTE